jgi:hypothetical protein
MKTPLPRRVDVSEITEVFVDELRFLTFDGHQLRMEFDVVRKDGGSPEDDSRAWTYTASRIVMSAHGVPALLDQMLRLNQALRQQQKSGEAGPAPHEPVLQWKGGPADRAN